MKAFHFPPQVADEMIQAVLDERKNTLRLFALPEKDLREFPRADYPDGWWFRGRAYTSFENAVNACQGVRSLCRFKRGDVLYVRETWCINNITPHDPEWSYKVDYDCTVKPYCNWKWHPSIHMLREAARIFLRVTDVRVERLQEITHGEIAKEGIVTKGTPGSPERINPFYEFMTLWNSPIKPADLPIRGWNANPWVFVVEFERISKEEALKNA